MKLNLHFFLLNENFSPEYAEANHNGQETENNQKYEWEDELDVTDLKSYEILRNSSIPLEGKLPTDEDFSVEFSDMFTLELTTDTNQKARLGVSESIFESYELIEIEDGFTINIFIKDYEPHGNPVPGIYVASKEFPQELVF